MPNVSYPFDTTGLLASNLIAGEAHTLTEINANTYRILIPEFAPFYLDNFVLEHVDQLGAITTLQEGIHYILCLPYIGAVRSTGKMIYGGVSITDLIVNGTVRVTYQTIGGDWTADASYVLNALAEQVYNPRTTVWDVVTNKPNQFPPTVHNQHMDNVFGHQVLIDAIDGLADTIVTSSQSAAPSLVSHLLDDQNPHFVTPAQLGLGNIENLPLASDAEVMARAHVDKYITLRQLLLLLP